MPEQPKNIKFSVMLAIIFILIVALIYFFKIYPQYKQSDIIQTRIAVKPSETISPTQQVVATDEDITKNWKFFESPNLGYKIKYPQAWFVSSLSDINLDFRNSSSDDDYIRNQNVNAPLEMNKEGVWITVEMFFRNGKFFTDIISELSKERNIDKKEDLKINQFQAIKQFESDKPDWQGERGYYVVTYIDTGEKVYRFTAFLFLEDTYIKQEKTVNAIINSFQLLNP